MSLPAPPSRKSPIKHIVHKHHRRDSTNHPYQVRQYYRGKGAAPPQAQPSSRGVGSYLTGGKSGFDVKFNYVDGKSEELQVDGRNLLDALDSGFSSRKSSDEIRKIAIRRFGQ